VKVDVVVGVGVAASAGAGRCAGCLRAVVVLAACAPSAKGQDSTTTAVAQIGARRPRHLGE
jgi:hypothetical protein